VAIVTAKLSDARALVSLRAAVCDDMTRRFGAGDWSTSPSEADVRRQLRASRVLVASIEKRIIGTVRLTTARPWSFDCSAFSPVRTALYVLGLAVAPDVRGQGVGRQLMDAVKRIASASPADAVWLDAYDHAAGAGEFYRKCGFRKVGGTVHGKMPLVYYEWLVGS
jgi:ribosomal protein S18 acetylase RimI-like enzyme